MHKKILPCLAFVVALAVPYFIFASDSPAVSVVGKPSVTAFGVSGPFVAGSTFTITLGNVPDLTKLSPTVSLNGTTLTVTGAGATTISGKLTDGVSKKGGDVQIHYGGVTVSYTLYIPFIDNLFLPKIGKDAQMNINGGNFSDAGCGVNLPSSSITVNRCAQGQIIATIGSKLTGGDLTVTSNGLTSAPYHFVFESPSISFAENKDGVFPGSTLRVHAKGMSSTGTENQVFLDSTLLEIAGFKPNDGLILVKLPPENAKGSLKLVVNGIESNTLSLDSSFPPIITDYKITDSADKTLVKAIGKNFTSDISKATLSIGDKSATVKFANVNNIEGELPKGSYAGCLMVSVYGQNSNCILFNSTRPPVLKGFLDPLFMPAENNYEWSLFAENLSDKNSQITVYVNGTKAAIKDRLLNRLVVTFDPIPDVGEVYVVSEGLESNRMPYNFGERFYPFIASATSNGKFMYAQPITISGNNLGQQQFQDKTQINISGVGLAKKENTNELDWKVSPAEITIRLDDKVKAGAKSTLSVTVKGKKSNEVTFTTGQDSKQSLCTPWIQKVQYPEGIMEGSTIRVLGQCFDPDATKNWLYFDDIGVKPTYSKNTILEAKIPKGAKTKGTIKVKTDLGQSNATDIISAGQTPNAFTFGFEDLGTNILSGIGSEGPFAKLVINNTLGEVEMQTLKFKFVYEDDKKDPNSVTKLGSPPLGEIKVSFSGVGSKTIAPMVIQREGTNTFSLTLDGIRISPSTSPQYLEFRTTVRPYVLNGAKFHLEFDPSKIENFSGLLIQRDKQDLMKITQKAIQSKVASFTKTEVTCFDTDSKKANCLGSTATVTTPIPAQPVATPVSTKPKIPKIPK
jgi:hypothetical protein